MLSRPVFIIGFSMIIFPILVGNPVVKPMRSFLSHEFWVPLSRLSYGAFLCHGIFMQFREYNTERGQWACAFDAILFFLAYLTFSFIFSFFMAISFDLPISALWYELAIKKNEKSDMYLHS